MNYIYYVSIIFMKKFVRPLISLTIVVIAGFASLVLAQVISSRNSTHNKVPDYYYANYKFNDDWEGILDWFTKAKAKYSIGQDFSSSEFAELSRHFDRVFPYLTKDYSTVYEKCSILAKSLANNYSYINMEALMWNSCYNSLTQAINRINSSYTVQPSVTSNPAGWMAPLTVTFDARNSSDPSQETIPENNFYRYYRDEKWVDTPIWEKQVLSYTFKEAGKFIVHLVVRSSNVDKWILDWERNLTINVTPKAADIVVYANTRRMVSTTPLKIWISEWEKWVVFDWSLTQPRWWRKILKHRWTITNSSAGFSYDSKNIDGTPSYINVPLNGNWLFKVTLTTVDNENNTVSESFDLYMSDPVTVIRQTPESWTTSTIFNFDGSASYSLTSRLNTYIWEVFDWNWDSNNGNKVMMVQGKEMRLNENRKLKPGNYLVRLTVTDAAWNQNVETKYLNLESTTPTPQFTVTPTSKRTNPSEFTLDASNTSDIDVDNWVDSLEYSRSFSTSNDNVEILSTKNNNQRIVVRFDEKGKHTINLTVTDQYWKSATISKDIDVNSTLRPELKLIPWPITWQQMLQFKSSVNREVWNYSRDFWDGTVPLESKIATETEHKYSKKWIYAVRLTVTDQDEDTNTVLEKAFIWEINHPIVAYQVTNNEWFQIQSTESCTVKNESWVSNDEMAYPVDRYSKVTINPSTSVNTKWTSNWLEYVFEKESIAWLEKAQITSQLTTSFNETGCHYVDLTVKDSNVWKQDKTRIWFYVKNALPTIGNVTVSYPQASDNYNSNPFASDTNSTQPIFGCSGTSNITVRVAAEDISDSDWNVSRLRFYYYNTDDPSRILEYKESWYEVPYVYFVIPKRAGEYKFGVMVYDNDEWMVDSNEYLASNPSLYIPAVCEDTNVPIVTLRVDHNNIQVWDEITYSIVSKISTENDDFKTDRTFYYDFTWDGIRDLVTKKDSVTHTFTEAYEDWFTPRAGVEYRWKLWQARWATIFVKNGIRPALLYNAIWNIVIFRDLSVWIMQRREICFEKSECEAWNVKFRRTHISPIKPEEMTWGTSTPITEHDCFIQKYDEYWAHNVSIYLKNRYWVEVTTWFIVKTSANSENWRIAPWVNIITIPETTFNNTNPEIFLNKAMNNIVVMYINNENGGTCYVDKDIEFDTDNDRKSDNDVDLECNKLAKIEYDPAYESTVWRIYFTNNGKLTFKNFYVTFEGIIMELDEEKKEIYDDITQLFNGIEDISLENTNLKKSLDKLRKNLTNRSEVTSLVITINDQINEWWIKMDQYQKELLESILARLSNEDTIVFVWISEYEKYKKNILAIISDSQWTLKSTVEKKFRKFEENVGWYSQEEKAKELESIRELIIKDGKKNKWINDDEWLINQRFCNVFDYFEVSTYTKKCDSSPQIVDNYDKSQQSDAPEKSEKKWFPLRLKIILIILLWWLLVMWWVIAFFSIKARLNSSSENDEDEW